MENTEGDGSVAAVALDFNPAAIGVSDSVNVASMGAVIQEYEMIANSADQRAEGGNARAQSAHGLVNSSKQDNFMSPRQPEEGDIED